MRIIYIGRNSGYGLRVTGYEVRVTGYEVRVVYRKKSFFTLRTPKRVPRNAYPETRTPQLVALLKYTHISHPFSYDFRIVVYQRNNT